MRTTRGTSARRFFVNSLAVASLAGAALGLNQSASATILITEINSNAAAGGDFFELYNSGSASIDLTGWRWADYDLATTSGWGGAASFDATTLAAGQVAVVGAGSNSGAPTPLNGSESAATAFRTSWGLAGSVPVLTWTGTGAGLGSGDGIVLYNASGNVAASTIYRIAPDSAVQQGATTVPLTTFVKSFVPQPTANGHAGVMGGVGATPAGVGTESLVWDPSSPVGSPTYRNAVLNQWGSFANPNSAVSIGSPGVINVVPEPSTVALAAAGIGLAGLAARRRLRRA
jgi:hypothetical protein